MGPEVMLGPEVTLGAVVLAVLLTPRAHTKPVTPSRTRRLLRLQGALLSHHCVLQPGVAFVLQRVLAASPPGNGNN